VLYVGTSIESQVVAGFFPSLGSEKEECGSTEVTEFRRQVAILDGGKVIILRQKRRSHPAHKEKGGRLGFDNERGREQNALRGEK